MRERKVRLHLEGNAPSIEGILVGWPRRHAGHYVLRMPQLIEAENQSVSLDGRAAWVPKDQVVFLQEL